MSDKGKELAKKLKELEKREQWDEMIGVCNKIINSASSLDCKVIAYNGLGLAYESKGFFGKEDCYDRAIQCFSKTIELDPANAVAYHRRGVRYLIKGIENEGDNDKAIQDLTKAVELDPNNVLAYRQLGFAYIRKKDYVSVIQNLTKAIEVDPNDVGLYFERGHAHIGAGNHSQAIQDFTKLIELDPNDVRGYHGRGRAYFEKKDYDVAIQDFVKASHCDEWLKSNDVFVYIARRIKDITSKHEKRSEGEWGELFEYLIKLGDVISKIKESLLYRPKGGEVAHYTSLQALRSLAKRNPFRLYNASYMNDPEEGQAFFEIMKDKLDLDVKEKFYKSEESHVSPAYIGSFVEVDEEDKDKLFLWRTYGKQNNEEAAGACLIFKAEQFFQTPNITIGAMYQWHTIYKVVYCNKGIVDEEGKSILTNMKELLVPLLEEIEKFCDSHEDVKEDFNSLVREVLDGIRFLFKATHYREEKEVRIIQMDYKQHECKVDMERIPPRFYLEIPVQSPQFSEVILGPRAKRIVEWQQWLGKKMKGVKVQQSKIPFGEGY